MRDALSIADPQDKKSLNDDGQDVNIKSIEEKVKQFRDGMADSKDYEKMLEQIDKYWDKLFADPITVTNSAGQFIIQPQRTNNILERFFRDLKRRNRKRSGTISLNKTLRFMLTDTPLVKNLDNPEYLEVILDGCRSLEERFERIDSRIVAERLKAEQRRQQNICSEMKKIIQLPDLPDRLSALLAQ